MTAIVYPTSLPMPQAAPIKSAERRALSPDGGPYDVRAQQRDRLAYQDVTFPPMDAVQTAAFRAWWKDDLYNGGARFAATWPLPQGLIPWVRRFMGPPHYEFIPTPQGNFWRITARFEVFGRGELPEIIERHDDVVMLLHMDALPFIDEVGRVVTMHGSDISITTGVGTSIGHFDSAAVWGGSFDSWATMVNDEKMDFGAGPGPTIDVWLRELPSQSVDGLVLAVAKDASGNQYNMLTLTANVFGAVPRYQVMISDTAAGAAWVGGTSSPLTLTGHPASIPTAGDPYTHIRFGRCSDTVWKMAVNGIIQDSFTTPPGLLFNGTVASSHGLTYVGGGLNTFWDVYSDSPIDEMVARKRWMDTANFTPPALRFEYP